MENLWSVLILLLSGIHCCYGRDRVVPCTQTHYDQTYPCHNGATRNLQCRDGGYALFSCTCQTGYLLKECSLQDHCLRSPCMNGGICHNEPTRYTCQCQTGFYGKDCEINHCLGSPCRNGGTCHSEPTQYTCQCRTGIYGKDCEINHCLGSPCRNGGTCHSEPTQYTCQCQTGFYGKDCEINFCLSGPCQNGGTCRSHPSNYTCECIYGFYGNNCEQKFCDPTKADMVFLLDSSISMTEEMFKKQKEFINAFIDHVNVGPSTFLFGVITFSTRATIRIHLDDFTTNDTLKQAVEAIPFDIGATFTDKGLSLVESLLRNGSRHNNFDVTRFLVVITDGMSTDRQATKSVAMHIKNTDLVHKIVSIGVGPQVSHMELTHIASNPDSFTPSYVYSVQNFDALFTVVKELVHISCTEYIKSRMSDVVLLLDAGPFSDYKENRLSFSNFLMNLNVDQMTNGTRAHFVVFGNDVNNQATRINVIENAADKHSALTQLAMIRPGSGQSSKIVATFQYIKDEIFDKLSSDRQGARKFIVVFSNGNFSDLEDERMTHFLNATSAGGDTSIFAIGTGHSILMENLLKIVNDPFNTFVNLYDGDNANNLHILQSFFTFNTELDG